MRVVHGPGPEPHGCDHASVCAQGGPALHCQPGGRGPLHQPWLADRLQICDPLQEEPDNRDNRPLVYDGRLIVPTGVKDNDIVFKNTPLVHGRTDMAEMLPGGRMRAIDDVSAGVVPVTTDLDGTVNGSGAG